MCGNEEPPSPHSTPVVPGNPFEIEFGRTKNLRGKQPANIPLVLALSLTRCQEIKLEAKEWVRG